MINYGNHFIDKSDISFVVKAMKGKKLTQGVYVEKFEAAIRKKFDAKYCCVVSSGTAALHLSCLALNLKNKNVITTPNTFLASANSILYSGAKIDFVDINEKTFNIDIKKLEIKIKNYKKNKKKIAAVIATDYAGLPCDWNSLKKISKKYNFKLINDNCHAMGAKLDGKEYALRYADIATHSYHPVKNFTTGEGGAILTNDKKIFDRVKSLRNHGLERVKKNNELWPFRMRYLGFNYRITDFQCALGLSQLKKLKKFLNRRKQIAAIYDKELKNINCLTLQSKVRNCQNAYHIYPVKIDFKKAKISKEKLIRIFKSKNIHPQTHYFPIHLQPYYKKNFNFSKGDYPVAENYFESTLSLPIFYSLKNIEIYKIINILKQKLDG